MHNIWRETWVLALLALVVSHGVVRADDRESRYVSASKLSLIGAASASVLWLGHMVSEVDTSRRPFFSAPLPGEAGFQRLAGGRWHPGKSNFLDHQFGSAVTATALGATMVLADLTWPRRNPSQDAGEDFALYMSGLIATKGVTSLAKGLFARPRPMVRLEPELARQRTNIDPSYDYNSFFSGHSSSAFFSATFVNHRLRDILRQRMNADEYRQWRWLPPAVLFSWSSFVGWTRIHAYKHYLSDVLVGSLAGYLLGELFYSFLEDVTPATDGAAEGSRLVTFRITF